MATLTIEIPDDLYDELKETATELKSNPSDALILAYNHFMQTEVVDNAVEGMERSAISDENLISFPELKEELDIDINFHPLAMEELESLDEEDQIELIGQLIERLSQGDEDLADDVDLVLNETEAATVLLSSFDFGDIVYRVNDEFITIYHIALSDAFDEELDLDDEELDDEFEEIDELDGELEFEEDEEDKH